MKKYAITALALALLTPMASMAGDSINSLCGIKANGEQPTFAQMTKDYNTNNSQTASIRALPPEEKVACGAIIDKAFQKGLVGNRDKFSLLKINLDKKKDGSYKYTAKLGILDYKSKSGQYHKTPRVENISGTIPLLPILPPTATSPILGEPPRVN